METDFNRAFGGSSDATERPGLGAGGWRREARIGARAGHLRGLPRREQGQGRKLRKSISAAF